MANFKFRYINLNMINQTASVNFTGRCPAIRQGQWASHVVNAYLPHQSVMRYQPLLDSTMERTKIDTRYSGTFEKYPKEVLAIINKQRLLNEATGNAREAHVSTPCSGSYYYAVSRIEQLLEEHLGNCHENAEAAETILRANGVKNPVTVALTINDSEKHVVCMFNRDGSKVKTIENNNTIIVDPWIGIVDFANNAIMKYRTIFEKYIIKDREKDKNLERIIPHKKTKNNEVSIDWMVSHPMKSEDIKFFKKRFPQFIQTKRPD